MRHLPEWLRRQRAQLLVNLGRVAIVGAASQATTTLRAASVPESPIYVMGEGFVTGEPAVVSCSLDPPFDVIEESIRSRGAYGMVKRFLRHDLDPGRARPLGNAMCLAVAGSKNYHHWLLEILPNVAIAEDSGYRGVYLIPEPAYIPASLALLGIGSDRLVNHSRDDLWRIARLHVPTWIDGALSMRQPAPLANLRQKLLTALPKAGAARRLYVSRNLPGRLRQVVNEPELKALLQRFGFEEFVAEKYPVAQQLAAFAAAEAAIGVDGAGFASALVMPRGALLISLFSPLRFDPAGTLVVARLNGLRYHTVFAHASPGGYRHGEDVVANLEFIEATLERELR